MPDLELSVALTDNERTRPILDGTITAAGIRMLLSAQPASDLFWRQLKGAEFDVSEMSLSDLMIAVATGNRDWLALPIYTLRRFYHTQILIRRDAGIAEPGDLRGKRVGVPEYQLTSIVWARGVIKDDFGVDAREMEWFVERRPEMNHGEVSGFVAPAGLSLSYLPPEKNLGQMLVARELDSLFHYITARNMVDRSRLNLNAHPNVTTLFADPVAEGRRYFASTGVYPVNHCVVVRRTLAERYPWVVLNIYSAFVAAKEHLDLQGIAALHPYLSAGILDGSVRRALAGPDPWAYGLHNSRKAVETIARYLTDQDLLARPVTIEELFAPVVMST